MGGNLGVYDGKMATSLLQRSVWAEGPHHDRPQAAGAAAPTTPEPNPGQDASLHAILHWSFGVFRAEDIFGWLGEKTQQPHTSGCP